MLETEKLMHALYQTFLQNEPKDTLRVIENLYEFFKDESLTVSEIDSAILDLFSNKLAESRNIKSLHRFVLQVFPNSKFLEPVKRALKLIAELIEEHNVIFSDYIEEIVDICLKILSSACTEWVKKHSILPLSAVVSKSNGHWDNFIPSIVEMIVFHISNGRQSPSVLGSEYILIGLISVRYPEYLQEHAEVVRKSLLSPLKSISVGKVKVSPEQISACIEGLNQFMKNFYENEMQESIYEAVKSLHHHYENQRRTYSRASLFLFAEHGSKFSALLFKDGKYWHESLLKWVNQHNKDDRYAGTSALHSFYVNVGTQIVSNGLDDPETSELLTYLMSYFENTLMSFNYTDPSKTYEQKICVENLIIFISKVKSIFQDNQFSTIKNSIIKQATCVYQSGIELTDVIENFDEATQKIEQMSHYVKALATICDSDDVILEQMLRMLVTSFPKCRPHRHYVILKAIKRASKVINLQNFISFLIKESCRHCISDSLYWKSEIEQSTTDPKKLTYETFIPIWRELIELKENDTRSKEFYQTFILTIMKFLPSLDVSMRHMNLDSNDQSMQDDDLVQDWEYPSNVFEYRLFLNACDLTATVISCGWTHEWLRSFLLPLLNILISEMTIKPECIGYLRILEALLSAIDNLEILKKDVSPMDEEAKEIKHCIQDLLKGLNISGNYGLLQVRSSLVMLYTPPIILDEELLPITIDAIKTVLKIGRNYHSLVLIVLEKLNLWDENINRELLRPLFKEILPILYEYLCSSGITDELAPDEEEASKYLLYGFSSKKRHIMKKGTSSTLATIHNEIIYLLGKMDSESMEPLMNKSNQKMMQFHDDYDISHISEFAERLKLSVPCPEQHKLELYLDSIIPRVKELATKSTNRDTRITACQVLHSLIVMIYGTCVSLPPSQKGSLIRALSHLNPCLITLAADEDTTISSIFIPLLKQSCHWLSTPTHDGSIEAANFLMTLIDCSTHPSNSLLRDTACASIKEYLVWSLKNSRTNQEDLLVNVSAILRRICQIALHPDPFCRQGTFLIFNTIDLNLYVIQSAIDKFFLELLYVTVANLSDLQNKECLVYKHEAMKTLKTLLKCLELKYSIFKRPSSSRRKPPGFEGTCLPDICMWILTRVKICQCQNTADMLFNSFLKLCSLLDDVSSPTDFLDVMIKKNKFKASCNKVFCFASIDLQYLLDCEASEINRRLFNFLTDLEFFFMLVHRKVFANEKLHQFPSVQTFIENINTILESNFGQSLKFIQMTQTDREKILYIFYKIEMKIYELIFISDTMSNYLKLSSDVIIEKVISLIVNTDKASILKKNSLSIKTIIKQLIEKYYDSFIKSLISQLEDSEVKLRFANFRVELFNSWTLNSLKCLIEVFQEMNMNNIQHIFRDWNISHVLKDLFNHHSTTASDIQNLETTETILTFIFKTGIQSVKDTLKILLNPDGINFVKMFKDAIISHMLSNDTEMYEYIIESINFDNNDCYLEMLSEIIQYITEQNKTEEPFLNKLLQFIYQLWPKIINSDLSKLLEIFSLITILLPNPFEYLGKQYNPLNIWVLLKLQHSFSSNVENDNKIIILLPTVVGPGKENCADKDMLNLTLKSIQNSFPLHSNEFPKHSEKRSSYILLFGSLLEAMANSGSFELLHLVMVISSTDKEHVCEKEISHKLKSFCKRLSPELQKECMSKIFSMFCDRSNNPEIRHNLLHRFLVPFLDLSSKTALKNFLLENIVKIVAMMNKNISDVKNQEWPLLHLFVEWIAVYNIINVMFSKIPFDELNSVDSEIGKCLFGDNIAPNKFLKEFFSRVIKMRDIELSSDDYPESVTSHLRLAKCAAYNCLHSIIIAQPKEDLKIFQYLIDNEIGTAKRLWEGLIDIKKTYTFSMISDQETKFKQVVVKLKTENTIRGNNNPLTESIDMPSLQYSLKLYESSKPAGSIKSDADTSRMIFKQSLCASLLKYDLNTSLIRDEPVNFKALSEFPQKTFVQFEKNEINEHECMHTICAAITDMHAITMSQMNGDSMSAPPKWIKCITDVLNNSTSEKNIRLFLAQVIDNKSDIFIHYAQHMIEPVLNVVNDYCILGNEAFVIYLITTLLSWSDKAALSSPNEIQLASSILKKLIQIVNINQQYADPYRNTLELINTILLSWGERITIPMEIIIEKLDLLKQNNVIGVHIVAAILNSHNEITKSGRCLVQILEILKSKTITSLHKQVYLPISETIGLILRTLDSILSSTGENEFVTNESFMKLLSECQTFVARIFDSKKENFIITTYFIQKHYPNICSEELMTKIIFLLQKLPIKSRVFCLKIIIRGVDVLSEEYLSKDIMNLGIEALLRDRDFRLPTLHILNRICEIKSPFLLTPFMREICDLVLCKEKDVRTVIFDILIKYQSAAKSIDVVMEEESTLNQSSITSTSRTVNNTDNVPAFIKNTLFQGLDDEDEEIRNKVFNFCTDEYPLNIYERWTSSFVEIFGDKSNIESNCISRFLKLILGVRNKVANFKLEKLFEHPLEECNFTDYKIDTRKRSDKPVQAPMFAETLNSQLAMSVLSSKIEQGTLFSSKTTQRLIQDSLVTPMQSFSKVNLDSLNSSVSKNFASYGSMKDNSDYNIDEESSLMFSLRPKMLHKRNYKPSQKNNFEDPKYNKIFKKLRRKMIVNKDLEAIKYSGIAARQRQEKQKKRLEGKPEEIFKNFREGDYPDVQMSIDDVLMPILGLSLRDVNLAQEMFIILFKALIYRQETNQDGNLKTLTVNLALKCLQTMDGQSHSVAISLLQLCRLCLDECVEIFSESEQSLVKNISGACNIRWLGDLLLEEVIIVKDTSYCEEPPAKKSRTDMIKLYQFPLDVRRNIRNMKTSGDLQSLVTIYKTITKEFNLSDNLIQKCEEEHLNTLRLLGDWDGILSNVEELYFSTTNRSKKLKYDVLLEDIHARNFYMPSVFDAYLQKIVSIDFADDVEDRRNTIKLIESFNESVNSWAADKKMNTFLSSSNLSWRHALWKSCIIQWTESVDSAFSSIDSDLQILRERLSAKSTQNSFEWNTLNIIQMISEVKNWLQCPLFSSSGLINPNKVVNHISKLLKTWKSCVPLPTDDITYWNIRLCARYTFAALLKTQLEEKKEDLSLDEDETTDLVQLLTNIQRHSNLHLVKAGIAQNYFTLCLDFIERHSSAPNMDDEASWCLQWIKAEVAKLSTLNSDPLSDLQTTLKIWQTEEIGRKTICAEDPQASVGLLINAGILSERIVDIISTSQIRESWESMSEIKEKIINITSTSGLQISLAENVSQPENACSALTKCSLGYFKIATVIVDNILTKSRRKDELNSAAEAYLSLVKYCERMQNKNISVPDVNWVQISMKSLLKAIKYENEEARKLLPAILLELTNEEADIQTTFINEVSDIPSWYFLPWLPQILAKLPYLVETLLPLVVRMAQDYPEALYYPYQLSKEVWVKNLDSGIKRDIEKITSTLDGILMISNEKKMFRSCLLSLRVPFEVLYEYIENLLKTKDETNWDLTMNKLFHEVFDEDDENIPKGPIHQQMNSFRKKFEAIKNFNPDRKAVDKNLLNICQQVDAFVKKNVKEICSISDFSPLLASFGDTWYHHHELPGQYNNLTSKPHPNKHITVAKIENAVTVMTSMRKPIKITILGSDGHKYPFLVKSQEDLRQDDRIQQVLELMNHIICKDDMNIRTYNVTPISTDVGLIEYKKGCATLKDLVLSSKISFTDIIQNIKAGREQLVGNTSNSVEMYGILAANLETSKKLYTDSMKTIPKYILRNIFVKLAASPDNFISMRNNFTRSMAPMNIAHWILGIGDRHLSNCLVDLRYGSIIGIDFSHAFGSATQLLAVPELIPFRFTGLITDVVAPDGPSGYLHDMMAQSLQKFSEHSAHLLATMKIFITETSLNWKAETLNTGGNTFNLNEKVEICHYKLQGVQASHLLIEDLKKRIIGKEFIKYYINAVKQALPENFSSDVTKKLDVDTQVDLLIRLSTDPGILSITYEGWLPWF